MLQKLKDWLVDLLGGYPHSEIEVQRIILDEVYKREQELKKKLELIESDLKNSDDNSNIEIISRHLILAMDKVKNREYRIFGNYEYDCDTSILAICRDFEQLLVRKNNRKLNKLLNIGIITNYQNSFLEQYQFFKTIEWKKKENKQFEAGEKFK